MRTGPTWWCMECSICWAMTTRKRPQRSTWNNWRSRSWQGWGWPSPMGPCPRRPVEGWRTAPKIMAEDRSGHEAGDRSWIEKIADAFSPEPRSRRDLLQALRSAADSEVIDRDAQSIMEGALRVGDMQVRSEEHTSELQSRGHLVCRLLLEKKKEATRG